jgi:hypothetical protein
MDRNAFMALDRYTTPDSLDREIAARARYQPAWARAAGKHFLARLRPAGPPRYVVLTTRPR